METTGGRSFRQKAFYPSQTMVYVKRSVNSEPLDEGDSFERDISPLEVVENGFMYGWVPIFYLRKDDEVLTVDNGDSDKQWQKLKEVITAEFNEYLLEIINSSRGYVLLTEGSYVYCKLDPSATFFPCNSDDFVENVRSYDDSTSLLLSDGSEFLIDWATYDDIDCRFNDNNVFSIELDKLNTAFLIKQGDVKFFGCACVE